MNETILLRAQDVLGGLPARTLALALLDKLPDVSKAGVCVTDPVPRIGTIWAAHGGIYAGMARGIDGEVDYPLIVGPETPQAMTWQDVMEWAKSLDVDGHRDFTAPLRCHQSLCFANVPELFKPESYWSCEQCAGNDAYAWVQGFTSGDQGNCHKYTKFRARAVRRSISNLAI
jgi:hypothetical protein